MKDNTDPILVKTADEEQVALWKYSPPEVAPDKHVLITHGTFSNRKVCMGIASYLVELGYTCWIMEWRGHGASPEPRQPFNFETVALFDIPAVLNYLFEQQNILDISCVTHSGGGICMTMCLINNPQYKARINSMVFFGCQAFGAAAGALNYAKITAGKLLSVTLGKVPAGKLGLKEQNESYTMMKQWYNWNLKRRFTGKGGINYLERMPEVAIPIFSISGGGDTFIAPPEGCRLFLEAFKNPANQFTECSVSNGQLEDYDHSRILHSKNASREIWPLAVDWIRKYERVSAS